MEGLHSGMPDGFLTLPNWSKIRTHFSAEPKRHTYWAADAHTMPVLSALKSCEYLDSIQARPADCGWAGCDFSTLTVGLQTRVRGCVPKCLYLKCYSADAGGESPELFWSIHVN